MAETLRYIYGHYFGSGEMYAPRSPVPRPRTADGADPAVETRGGGADSAGETRGEGRRDGEPDASGERAPARRRRARKGR